MISLYMISLYMIKCLRVLLEKLHLPLILFGCSHVEEDYIQNKTIGENAEADLEKERNETVLQTHGLCWEAVAPLNGNKMF